MPDIEDLQAEVERLQKLLREIANSSAANEMGRAVDRAANVLRDANAKFSKASAAAARAVTEWEDAMDKQRKALEALLEDPSDANVRLEEAANTKCAQAVKAKDKAKDEMDAAEKELAEAKKQVEIAGKHDEKFFAMTERVRKLLDQARKNLENALKGDKDAKAVLANVKKL